MAYTTSGQWSMPLEEMNGNVRPFASHRDTSGSGSHERGQSANRDSNSTRRVPSDAWNVMSDSEGTKQRRQSLKATNAGAGRKRSRNTLREKKTEKTEKPADYVDDSAWIHRDKLEQIEIMEMEQAGIPIRQSRRSVSTGAGAERRSSRSQSRSRKSIPKEQEQEQMPADTYGTAYGGEAELEQKRMSAIHSAADEEEQRYDPNTDYEIRTPEEVAELSRSQTLRPSTSRIPVSKASPVPVPSNVVGRDSPLPRSRHGSASGTWDEMQYQRKARSGSMGSQAMLDEEDGVMTPPRPGSSQKRSSNENSPPKSRTPGKAAPTGRKPSTNGTQRPGSSQGNKARNASSTNGHKSRPSTSHAYNPEGDPPWLSSMYKPDPRLPPDQQMLPTHAKRLMQEQWEREGISGTTYDRDLRLVSDEPLPSPTAVGVKQQLPPPLNLKNQRFSEPEKQPSPSPKPEAPAKSPSSPNTTNLNAWPLTPASEKPSSPRPGTSGGYKITPTIQSPPQIQRAAQTPVRQTSPVRRVPELDEKEEARERKGGCGCCVVM